MSDFEIDFEWPVAKYEFQPATAEEVTEYQVRQSRELSRIPEAEWPLYLGRIVSVSEGKNHRPKATTMELAVKALVECKETPFHVVALKVARAVGTLWEGPKGDKLTGWRSVARQLRFMFEGKPGFPWERDPEYKWPHPATQDVGELQIRLVPDKDNKPLLALQPAGLHEALVFCAARMIATGTTFNICENCRTPFLSGGVRGRNKRGDARFCSSQCRWKHHNESRRNAR